MAKTPWTSTAVRLARAVIGSLTRAGTAGGRPAAGAPRGGGAGARDGGSRGGVRARASAGGTEARSTAAAAYPGDFTGALRPQYSPQLDGAPDPGEIVWTWVPYEEDFSRGKDRPVLLVGRDGAWLLGLMLTSKDHSRDAADEARYGRRWVDVGSGPWDSQGRDSEVRVDRVVRVDPGAVRREGAILPEAVFTKVVTAARR
ncbi:type II toxin-antitoxin system PemK/MazF family toxin [Sanguibacter inulinus]|uniref:Type II toxin-antitoxin system PemK/MazF family toxin n=1 Tax=Sanguibacter inulinus TaxID=60922 RepID=A0A853EZ56_9MICO|nr:type II toxin-antitoxin system PemK/MazF family toxin [Sanguibacter inulinus]MBF0723727.1 type II toxin-antitoxin system PemK/MazF family toxin [Sanguibacter inulinus]NYS94872.1 type II toxin-antitoxin system PemK/MazF family toxin [Sanguibacter inulinus]